ncbi:MAG: carboxypeptidase-like regulatory domain-containing protein [Bacteroidota bacterium]
MIQPILRFSFGLFLLFLTNSLIGQGSQIRGVVIDQNGEPLPAATVYLPEIKKGAYTNDEGIFSISRLEPGSYQIWAIYVGYDTVRQQVTIKQGQKGVNVKLVMQEVAVYTNEVEISATQNGKIETKEVKLGNVEVTAKDINLLPSVGAPDLLQYIQVLPGVVFSGDQGGQVYIRGGTPIQNMTLLDGMILYSPFHSIGLFSVFDPDYIRTADVYSAGFPANYGGRISSVIDVKTRNGNFNKFRGKVNFNPFSSNVLLEGPLLRSKKQGGGTSFLASVRNNYIDQTSNELYPYINDSIGLPFNFLDIYGKLTMSDGVNFANIFGFRHVDNVNYGFPASINWRASGGGANFMLLPEGAGAIIRGNMAVSNYETSLTSDTEAFPRNSSISGFNGGLDVSYIVNSVDEINAGIMFLGFRTDYEFTNSFGFRTQQEANNTELAPYVKYKKVIQSRSFGGGDLDSLKDLAVIEPSLRAHYFNDQAHFALEPRLRVKINLPRVSFSGATGWFTQNLLSAGSDRDVVNLFQGFLSAPSSLANRINDHNLQTAFHALAGVEVELLPNLSTTVELWMKDFTQLTNINRDKIFPEDPNFITETGLARGVDLVLKYATPELYLYGTYGLSRVTRDDFIREYPPVFDRRHNINIVAAYRLKRFSYYDDGEQKRPPKFKVHAWEFSLRWTMGSGFPFTQTQGYFEKVTFLDDGAQTDVLNQNGQLGLLLSDDLNGGRLPYFHRLDLSVKRNWVIRNKVLIEANGTLVNTYDRQNIFYFDRIRFEPVYQLPILPSLGITVSY